MSNRARPILPLSSLNACTRCNGHRVMVQTSAACVAVEEFLTGTLSGFPVRCYGCDP